MKGQIGIPTETMIKALVFVLITIVLVGILWGVSQYQLTYDSRVSYRRIIDFMENFLDARCLAYQEDGVQWRGIFDKAHLDIYASRILSGGNEVGSNAWNPDTFCIRYDKNYYVNIKSSENTWEFGTEPPDGLVEEMLNYPVAIHYPDKIAEGTMEVKTWSIPQ